MTKFIIFAHARSGSTSLTRALDLHPALKLAEEPFSKKYSLWHPGRKNFIDHITDAESLEVALSELFSEFDGIKILDYQLPEEIYAHMLLLPQYKVIYLRRRNLLQTIVSGFIAEQTSVWHISNLDDESAKTYQRLEPISLSELEKRLEYAQELRSYYEKICLKRPAGSTLLVGYEDLYGGGLMESRRTLEHILEFLGVAIPDMSLFDYYLDPKQSKINGLSQYELIPNFREIEDRFGSDANGRLLER